MSSIQYDYSVLSTSLSPSEIANANLIYNLNETAVETDASDESRDSNENTPRLPPPKDKFYVVYMTFGLLGVGTLLPWSFFITAHDYWMYKFRNVSSEMCFDPSAYHTGLQTAFTSYIALAVIVPYVVVLTACMFITFRIANLKYVASSLVFIIIVFIAITALVKVNTDSWQMQFFSLTLFLVVLNGFSSAILQSAAVGIVSVLPPNYIHVMVLGQAFAGIVATLAQIFFLIGHSDPVKSAFGYFLSADVILIVTLVALVGIYKMPFFQYYSTCGLEKSMKDVSSADEKIHIPFIAVIKWIWPYAVSLLVTFWVTIGIFPGLAVLVASENASNGSIWTGRLFLPLSCFLLFNSGDFCGRIFGGWLKYDPHSSRFRVLILSLLRVAFIPLFFFCNAHPRTHLPVLFGDIGYVVLISLLGLSNGSLVTVAMISGTKCVNLEMQEMAGIIFSAFLGAGLMLGSISSYLFILCL